MQDLGLCDGVDNVDGLNMSDADLTFENYEDVFGSSHDQSDSLFKDPGAACSSMERDVSLVELSGHIDNTLEVCLLRMYLWLAFFSCNYIWCVLPSKIYTYVISFYYIIMNMETTIFDQI